MHSGPMRFAELDSFVDGVLNGGPLEQKLQAPGRVVLVMSVKFMASTTPPRKFQAKDKGFSNHSLGNFPDQKPIRNPVGFRISPFFLGPLFLH